MNSKISTNVFEEAGITPETLIKLGLPQDSRSLSPMMVHYCQTKCAYKDSIIFYRLGDFYEMFFEDAKTVSRELELTLTGKDCGLSERAPMCGIPYHAAETYINRLIDKGYKVAICEQVEDPKTAKGIVKREVTRVVTPGTNLNMQELDEGKNNYLMAIVCVGDHFGVSTADITTGDCYVTEIDEERKLWDEINKFLPAEIICNDAFLVSGVDVDDLKNRLHISVFALESWYFGDDLCKQTLLEHFKISSLEGLGLADYDSGVIAAGSLFRYLLDTQKNTMEHMNKIIPYTTDRYMVIDSSSRRNLELVETLREKQKRGSLLWVLDKTKTAMGARMLRNFVEQPLIDANAINERLDAVTELNMQALPEDVLRGQLRREFPQAQEEDITAAIDRSGGFLGQAMSLLSGGGELPQQTRDFVQAFSARDALGLMQTLTPMEKWKRDALADTLESWRELLESALASRSGIRAVSPLSRKLAQSRSSPELLNAVQCLQKAVDYTTGNVSPAAVCGWLEWALR